MNCAPANSAIRTISRYAVSIILSPVFVRDVDPVLAKKPGPGLCTSNEGKFSKVL